MSKLWGVLKGVGSSNGFLVRSRNTPKCLHLQNRYFASSTKVNELKKTPLHDYHVKMEGRMVDFCGWALPVQYRMSIIQSHIHTRTHCSIFDVSHMMQTQITGKHCIPFLQSLTVADIEGLKPGSGTLSVFTNENGGILDDLIINKVNDEHLYVVSNAGCADKIWEHLQNSLSDYHQKKSKEVTVEHINKALLAVQGPEMTKVLQPGLTFNLEDLPFMTSTTGSVFGVEDCRITRCGYTGEDGVEISLPQGAAVEIVDRLRESKEGLVKMAGLGARDTLRLEAGLCLYGNDIDENTTPVEASLVWTIGKNRRKQADFPGAKIILEQIKNKPSRRRVGFESKGQPARAGAVIYCQDGKDTHGALTSGCPSPSLNHNISMGYVDAGHAKTGTKVKLLVRKRMIDATVVKMPFVPAKYYSGKK